MSLRHTAIAAAALSLAAFVAPSGVASAADLPVKAVKKAPDLPFFLVIDDRMTYSWMPKGTDPGAFSAKPGGGFDGTTAKSLYTFTHFDVWAYGTNFFLASLIKSDHNDPAGPCTNAGVLISGAAGACSGATEFFGKAISTFGWNELFNTKAFTMGPLHNISFQVAMEGETENTFLAPNKRAYEAGLQFMFDLPYKGYFSVSPLAYKETNHNAFTQCGLFGPGIPGVTCNSDGVTDFNTTWAVEMNYYMDLNFLPENMQYWAISGRAGFYGPKGNQNQPLGLASGGVATKTEINSEPIRLTFDASKAFMGPKYSQFVTTWVAYRFWQNKFGLDDSNPANSVCYTNGVNNHSCTESTVYAGVTVKF